MTSIPRIPKSWFKIMAVAVAIVAERIAAHAFGTSTGNLGFDLAAASGLGWVAVWGIAHCDGLDGPVVQLAIKALDTGNVNYVLPWVQEKDEPEIRSAFEHALSVRRLGPEAKALADRHFFETIVRVHRAGEGAPYTGLKPAGRDLGPAIPAADTALEDGSIEKVIRLVSDALTEGIRHRYHEAHRRAGFAPDEVRAGREFVDAYVTYIHYVERLWEDATARGRDHHDLLPANGTSRNLATSVLRGENGTREAVYGVADHRLSEGRPGGGTGQGSVSQARFQ